MYNIIIVVVWCTLFVYYMFLFNHDLVTVSMTCNASSRKGGGSQLHG